MLLLATLYIVAVRQALATGNVATYNTWSYTGCYSDGNTRSLSSLLSISSKTVEACLTAATTAAYAWAGLEYGGECWAGNTLSSSSTVQSASSCNMVCNSNSNEWCGGSLMLSLYSRASVTSIPQSVSTFTYQGCYQDGSTRTFTTGLSPANQTVEGCISACQSAGLTYCAMEYGGECYGGMNLTSSNIIGDASCSMHCNGQNTEFCGGSWALQVYEQPAMIPVIPTSYDVWTFQNCYSDTSSRQLYANRAAATKTVEGCLNACKAAGDVVCGMEYGGECWGSSALGSAAVALGTGSCNMLCTANQLEYCGGNLVLQVYSTTAVLPIYVTSYKTWTYSNCYSDYGTRTLLSGLSPAVRDVEHCLDTCSSAGYTLCGVEYYGECYGANAITAGASVIAENNCHFVCSGNAREFCGGGNAIQVFSTPTTTCSSGYVYLPATGTCSSMQTDINNCGAAHNACPSSYSNGVGSQCVAGICQPASCNTGYGWSSTKSACIGTTCDVNNCGSVGNVCPSSLGSPQCTSGTCSYSSCCGSLTLSSGTCGANTQTDINNCGAIGNVCPTTWTHGTGDQCVAGVCQPTSCDAGYSFSARNAACVLTASLNARVKRDKIKSVPSLCPLGERACPISGSASYDMLKAEGFAKFKTPTNVSLLGSSGGYECLDTQSALESCGGCASLGEGRNCLGIPHVGGVGCNSGSCHVYSCTEGYRPNMVGSSCLKIKAHRKVGSARRYSGYR